MLTGRSRSSMASIWRVRAFPCTSALALINSEHTRAAPCSLQRRRKAKLQIPAIGARTARPWRRMGPIFIFLSLSFLGEERLDRVGAKTDHVLIADLGHRH